MKTRKALKEITSNDTIVLYKKGECQVCGTALFDGRRKFCPKHDISAQRGQQQRKYCTNCGTELSDGRSKLCGECKLALKVQHAAHSQEASNILEVKQMLDDKIANMTQALQFQKQLLMNQESMLASLKSVSFSLNYLVGESIRNKHTKKGGK